ncbi:hypothetical protein PGT21_003521 [Puccinia graminis f. sp. tritici]|uniref:Uncharacterized protein n=1 Tax=Puccinia graminis f. sp. tritici TaxID=56615 RepID=A0A5B0QVW8_PUCGR|nr:hypothetical protein PGT21_003521 [Puccinia graminis f. sp. tritici]
METIKELCRLVRAHESVAATNRRHDHRQGPLISQINVAEVDEGGQTIPGKNILTLSRDSSGVRERPTTASNRLATQDGRQCLPLSQTNISSSLIRVSLSYSPSKRLERISIIESNQCNEPILPFHCQKLSDTPKPEPEPRANQLS